MCILETPTIFFLGAGEISITNLFHGVTVFLHFVMYLFTVFNFWSGPSAGLRYAP